MLMPPKKILSRKRSFQLIEAMQEVPFSAVSQRDVVFA